MSGGKKILVLVTHSTPPYRSCKSDLESPAATMQEDCGYCVHVGEDQMGWWEKRESPKDGECSRAANRQKQGIQRGNWVPGEQAFSMALLASILFCLELSQSSSVNEVTLTDSIYFTKKHFFSSLPR